MRDRPRSNYNGPVVHKPEKMKDPNEQEDAARDDQIKSVAHVVSRTLLECKWHGDPVRYALLGHVLISASPE